MPRSTPFPPSLTHPRPSRARGNASVTAGDGRCRRSAGLRTGVFLAGWTAPVQRPALRPAVTDALQKCGIQSLTALAGASIVYVEFHNQSNHAATYDIPKTPHLLCNPYRP